MGRRKGAIHTSDMEEHILDHTDRNTGASMSQVGEELNVSPMTIWKVLHYKVLYHYHF
jgi:DNA-binding MurR/RpiR family transcriptional regulator